MVKKYIEFITESDDHSTANMLKNFARLSSGYQKEYFERKLSCLRQIEVHSVYDLFESDVIDRLRKYGRFQKKECYSNSLHAANILESIGKLSVNGQVMENPEVKYVEGYMTVIGIPIDHAFNKIGDYYFDVTVDFLLDSKDKGDYSVIGEWDYREALSIMAEEGYYGGVFDTLFKNSYKENVR